MFRDQSKAEYLLDQSIEAIHRNDLRTVTKLLKQYLQLCPDDSKQWNNLGSSYYQRNMIRYSLGCYAKAISLEPTFGMAYFNLGVSYFDLHEYEQANRVFKEGVRIDPEDAEMWFKLGLCCQMMNRYPDAARYYRKALLLDLSLEYAYQNLCMVQNSMLKAGNLFILINGEKEPLVYWFPQSSR